jgi:hypothetical protein
MHFTRGSNQMLRVRVVQLIALSGVFALAACEDVTAPLKEGPLPPPAVMLSQSASSKLESLGSSLDDMTGWSLLALPDGQGRANIIGKLNGLKGHLNSKQVAACQQDVTDARALLGSLSEVEQVEVGHVGLALDVVQAALDSISN